MIRPYSQVLAVLILCLHSVYTQCVDEQPSNCKVTGIPVENYDEEQVFEQLEISVINATTNRTVYAGQTAVFQYVSNSSIVTDIRPIVYINGCIDDSLCSLMEDNNKQTVTRTCTLNTSETTLIALYSFSPMILGGAKLCHQPTSILTILGPPLSNVSVDYSIDPSDGVTLTIDPSSIDISIITSIQYNLYDDNDNQLLYTTTFINNTIAVIPTNLFHDHTGIYRITIIPSNPAGNGPSTNITIDLTNANYSLEFTIQNTTIFTDANSFNMIVTIEVNNNSLLTVPNYLYLTTSCSNQEEVEHIVNMTYLINHHSNLIFIDLELLPGRRNCSLTVTDERDNTHTIATNQSTYYTASYQLVLQNDSSINISCFFIEGVTTIDGCIIIIYDNHNNRIDQRVFLPTDNVINLGPYNPGEYSVDICDINSGQYNLSDPVFTDTFIIDKIIPTTTTPTTTDTTVSSPSPTITVDPGGGSTTEGTPQNHNYLIIVIVAAVVMIVVVVLIAVTVIVIVRRRHNHNRGNFDINNGRRHGVDANGGVHAVDRTSADPYSVEATTATTIPTDTTNDVTQQPHAQVQQQIIPPHATIIPALLNSDRPCDLSSRNDHTNAIELTTTTTTTMDHDSDITQNSFFECPEEQSGNESVSFTTDPSSTTPLQSPATMEVPVFFNRQESTASNNTIVQSSPQRRPSHVKLSGNVIGDGLSDSQRNESIITLKDELLIPSTSTNQLPPIDTGEEEHTLSIHVSIAAQEDEMESKSAAIVSHTGNGDHTTSPTGTDSARSETCLLQDVRHTNKKL